MKKEIKNIELAPKINNLLFKNKDWTVPDAIKDLSDTYKIPSQKYNAIASAYSRWKREFNQYDIQNAHDLIKYISTENVTDFLEAYEGQDPDYAYSLNRFNNRKGAADSRKIIKIVRAMLTQAIK
jgi:hypothetical protein